MRDNLDDDTLYFVPGLSSFDYGHHLKTVTITFQKNYKLLDDYDKFDTARLRIANMLNFDNSMIKGKSWANGFFQTREIPQGRMTWIYDICDLTAMKAVAKEHQ